MTKWLVVLCALLLFGAADEGKYKPIADFFVADSIRTHIYPEYDSSGILTGYRARVFTPVCEIEQCYAIEVDLFWDLIGRFSAFDTIAGEGLTKLDHVPFTENDYTRLTEILSDGNSVLGLYSKEELVQNTRESELDGMTGATIREVKDLVIDGAVYSCYTLWHITHGPVGDSLRQATTTLFDSGLVKRMINQGDQEVNYFLIEHFSESDFKMYLPELLTAIDQGKGYYAKNAIERIPSEVLSTDMAQNYFQQNFEELNYFAQIALLQKLDSATVSDQLKNELARQLGERDSYKNELIRSIVGK